MGMEERILEPKAEGAPSRLGVTPRVDLACPEPGCRAGVSITSFRNSELFMMAVVGVFKSSLEFEINVYFEVDVPQPRVL